MPIAPSLPLRRSPSPPHACENGRRLAALSRPARRQSPQAGVHVPPRHRPPAPPPRDRPAPGSSGRRRPRARNAAKASRSTAHASPAAPAWLAPGRRGRIRAIRNSRKPRGARRASSDRRGCSRRLGGGGRRCGVPRKAARSGAESAASIPPAAQSVGRRAPSRARGSSSARPRQTGCRSPRRASGGARHGSGARRPKAGRPSLRFIAGFWAQSGRRGGRRGRSCCALAPPVRQTSSPRCRQG
jgi:hypothetical protein